MQEIGAILLNKVKIYFPIIIPILFYILFGQTLRRSHGHLRFNHLIFLSSGTLLFIWFHFRNRFSDLLTFKRINHGLQFAYILFSYFLVEKNELIYAENNLASKLIKVLLIINFILSLLPLFKSKFQILAKISSKINILSFITILLSYILVISASPNPHIDVFTVGSHGADFLLSGKNPYIQSYPDLYNGAYGYVAGYVYWPVILYTLTIGKFLFSDIRYAYIVLLFIQFLILQKYTSNKSPYAYLSWLAFPVGLFVLEQTWTEQIIITQFLAIIYSLKKEKFLLASILVGVMCATKQYAIFMAIMSFFYILKNTSFVRSIKLSTVVILTFFILTGPFLLLDYHQFIKVTVTDILSYSTRDDALSWSAYFLKFYNYEIPSLVRSLLPVLTMLLSIFYILKGKFKDLNSFVFTNIIIYLAVFLFGKQAFCNYYYLISFMLVVYILTLLDQRFKA
jgi:hypothetical protein